MIYSINAIFFAWIASFWSKSGGVNIAVALTFTLLALLNCAMAAPFIQHFIGQP